VYVACGHDVGGAPEPGGTKARDHGRLAEVVAPGLAGAALHAGHDRVDDDVVPAADALDFGANFGDDGADLVPGDGGGLGERVVAGEQVQVGTADPEVLGGDPYFVRGEGSLGDVSGVDIYRPDSREQNASHAGHRFLLW